MALAVAYLLAGVAAAVAAVYVLAGWPWALLLLGLLLIALGVLELRGVRA